MDKPQLELNSLQHHGCNTVSPVLFLCILTTFTLLVKNRRSILRSTLSNSGQEAQHPGMGCKVWGECNHSNFEGIGTELNNTYIQDTNDQKSVLVKCAVEGGTYEGCHVTGSALIGGMSLCFIWIMLQHQSITERKILIW